MHSNDNEDDPQGREWTALYDRIETILSRYGKEDPRGRADYWVLDDNYGFDQHKVLVNKLDMLSPKIVRQLRDALADYPNWDIVVAVDVLGLGEKWPAMGLIVRAHEVVDGLQRHYFPTQYRFLHYPDSRPGTDLD
ncbi:MAG: hypothetical protein AB7O50_09340 [Pseudolabrys sp.]